MQVRQERSGTIFLMRFTYKRLSRLEKFYWQQSKRQSPTVRLEQWLMHDDLPHRPNPL